MDRKPVVSSNVKSVGYDAALQELDVEFTNGGVYRYYGVTVEQHKALISAKSIGSHFSSNVRGKYRHTKQADAIKAGHFDRDVVE
jgi:hypothetical protein